jgi:hypothetical protein
LPDQSAVFCAQHTRNGVIGQYAVDIVLDNNGSSFLSCSEIYVARYHKELVVISPVLRQTRRSDEFVVRDPPLAVLLGRGL